ncbi:hypothetical protein C2G38_2193396 [Gigaspora rosea]|uniref:Uncharacterized protein n=1 Tax=Gigaspora rosea TaxID=44941 RepID=A0A397UXR5_9GLOM|nr:hypothetical protein C2G38_2193396 [Gigaspora rosea]
MSSIFVAFCFVKTTSGNDKFTTGTALYRTTDEEDDFREFTYKGFTRSTDSLIIEFEKNSIVLMIGRYVYHNNAEFLGFIQTIPVTSTSDSTCSYEDLPNDFPLLFYASIEPKSSPQSATDKINFTKQFNNQLDLIEEQYAMVTSYDSNKRRRTGLFTSSHKNSNNNPSTIDLPDLVNQIRTNVPEPQPSQESTTNKPEPRPPQESTTDKPEPQQTFK